MSHYIPTRAQSAKGGRARTPARAAAAAARAAARRGVRVNTAPQRERETLLADLATAVRVPVRGVRSIRVVAAHCGVSDRTVRRWLNGTDWPLASSLRAIRRWLSEQKAK